MSVLESMAYGLATISTNAGGIPQIIEHGINGYRVEAGDLQGLEKILIQVVGSTEEKERLGKAAQKRIKEHFNAHRSIDRLCQLYQEERE